MRFLDVTEVLIETNKQTSFKKRRKIQHKILMKNKDLAAF